MVKNSASHRPSKPVRSCSTMATVFSLISTVPPSCHTQPCPVRRTCRPASEEPGLLCPGQPVDRQPVGQVRPFLGKDESVL